MAIVVSTEMAGEIGVASMSHRRVLPRDDQLPDGCRVHIAGPIDGGWRVITVWDSEEQFQQFRDDKLIPTMQDAGEDGVAPKVEANPVHKHITA